MRASTSHYRLHTHWIVDGTTDEVAAILGDITSMVRWYPATCLEAAIVERGEPTTEIGKLVRMRVKGWMPHTLCFMFRVTEAKSPHEFTFEASGDFEGKLVCSVKPHGERVAVCFDWEVHVTKPFVRYLSWILRPIFVSNHLWVVARGEESLDIELRRRRAATRGIAIADQPPGPTFPYGPLSAYIKSRVWSHARLSRGPGQPGSSSTALATR